MDALAYSVYRENTIPLKRMYTQVEKIIVLSSAFVANFPLQEFEYVSVNNLWTPPKYNYMIVDFDSQVEAFSMTPMNKLLLADVQPQKAGF